MTVYDIRLSNTGWLDYNLHKDVRTITHRIEHMTGLSDESSEQLQIVNYGLGGFFTVHPDCFSVIISKSNEIILRVL